MCVCVCLRTASVKWNAPGKYGPHGELFFFLIQKEPAIVPDSETFSFFINPDIHTPFFSTDVLKKKEDTEMDVIPLVWGTNGKWAVQRVQCGRVKAKLCRKTKVCLPVALEEATLATMRCTSSVCMGGDKISLFLQDWELAKVALSCHMALDMVCQEMHEAW